MFSEELALCQRENFTHKLRSMIIDRVDFPGLDFQTHEILQATPSSTRFFFCFLGWLCLWFQFTHFMGYRWAQTTDK